PPRRPAQKPLAPLHYAWTSSSPFAHLLRFAPDAQEIAAPQLSDVALGVPAAQQFGGDVRGFTLVLPSRHAAAVIEIGSDADVIDADALHSVCDGIHQLGDRSGRGSFRLGGRRPQVVAERDYRNHSAVPLQQVQFLVAEVAGCVDDGADARM